MLSLIFLHFSRFFLLEEKIAKLQNKPYSRFQFHLLLLKYLRLNIVCNHWNIIFLKGRDSFSPGLVGLSITYALSISHALGFLVRVTSEVETNIVAAERLKEFENIPKEDDWIKDCNATDDVSDWPKNGKIEFVEYSLRYRQVSPYFFQQVS